MNDQFNPQGMQPNPGMQGYTAQQPVQGYPTQGAPQLPPYGAAWPQEHIPQQPRYDPYNLQHSG